MPWPLSSWFGERLFSDHALVRWPLRSLAPCSFERHCELCAAGRFPTASFSLGLGHGRTHGSFSCWGRHETFAPYRAGPSVGRRPYRGSWDDVQHHCRDGVPFCQLQDGSSLATSYFRLWAKKRASRPWIVARIQNAFLQDVPSALPRRPNSTSVFSGAAIDAVSSLGIVSWAVWAIYRFDMTLGFPGEGPKWPILTANVDSFSTNFNCLQWDADVTWLSHSGKVPVLLTTSH